MTTEEKEKTLSSRQSTLNEMLDYLNDLNPGWTELDREQIKQLFQHLCSRMGIGKMWTNEYGDYLTGEAFARYTGDALAPKMSRELVMNVLNDFKMRPLLEARHPHKCVVLGGGAYGTAIATVLARKGHRVTIAMLNSEQEVVHSINKLHRNSSCFPDVPLHPFLVTACCEKDMPETLADADYIMLAIPVQFIKGYLSKHKDIIPPSTPIVCVSKGIDAKSGLFLSEIIPTVLPTTPVAFLAGPSFAAEMMNQAPTCVTVACEDAQLVRSVQLLFSSPIFRVFTTDDVWGVEVGSALKNVLAIACGVLAGLGYGPNTKMAIVTRGWGDIRRLARGYGAREETMTGLAGIGDVMLTCFGGLSRNSRFGNLLSKTGNVEKAMEETNSTVEGYFTSFSIKKIARERKLRLPVLEAIQDMLEGKLTPQLLATHVMTLPLSPEEVGLAKL